MKTVNIYTVAAEIDATGYVNKGKRVAIRYVNRQGEIREMIVSKRVVEPGQKAGGTSGVRRQTPNNKREGLLQIVDHTRELEEPKTIFLYGIVAFNPDADLSNLYPVI